MTAAATDGLPSTGRALIATYRMAWEVWPAGVLLRVWTMVNTSLVGGIGQGYALKRIVDTTAAGEPSLLWLCVLLLLLLQPWSPGALFNYAQGVLMRLTERRVTETIADAALAHGGIEHLETPVFADRLASLRQRSAEMSALVDTSGHLAGIAVGALIAATALAAMYPLLIAPIPLAVAGGVLQRWGRKKVEQMRDGTLPDHRLAVALADAAISPRSAGPVRMYGLGPWLLSRHAEASARLARRVMRGELSVVLLTAGSGAVQALIVAATAFFTVQLARRGVLSPGEVAFSLLLTRSAIDLAAETGGGVARLTSPAHVARQYLWLGEHRSKVAAPAEPLPVPDRLVVGIDIRKVGFTYTAGQSPTLVGVDLQLPAGSVVAFVGDNGAGKSTLVKLLLRLYDPTAGTILIDGHDLRQFDPAEWRARVSGALQDFGHFEFRASDAIGLGDVTHIDDGDAVRAAAKDGGAEQIVARLPQGLATQLGPERDGGVQLSKGEWQRIAMSRGAMRRQSLLLVLDEPTAALDARAEHELFERFALRTAEMRANGGIAVIVSHRFSTVRMADTIVVLEHGRVVETGTHHELVAAAGKYAEAYGLQAQRYR